MEHCRFCRHFKTGPGPVAPHCELAVSKSPYPSIQHKTAVKACERAIFLSYVDKFSGKVLEVGPGVYRAPRKAIRKVATWYGVDPAWRDSPAINAFHGNVKNLPFEDNFFDWVVALSTVEHWNEYGTTVEEGMREIHRVLKPGGRVLMTAPYHNHGHDIFYLGLDNEISRVLRSPGWSYSIQQKWGMFRGPLPDLQEWRIEKHRVPGLLEHTKGKEPTTYTLEFFAEK